MTPSAKTCHLLKILDIDILVPSCSLVFALCSGEVRFTIAHTILKLYTVKMFGLFQPTYGCLSCIDVSNSGKQKQPKRFYSVLYCFYDKWYVFADPVTYGSLCVV